MNLIQVILPELILIGTACALFLMGIINKPAARRASALIALIALIVVFVMQFQGTDPTTHAMDSVSSDSSNTFRIFHFAQYIKLIASGVGILLLLLAWPTDQRATGNSALSFGEDASEFFALMLLAISGIFIVAGANDMVLLFLGIELASIPTYIMVSVSRPLPSAQEAGVKYFFLGALAAAVLLFGFSYLYGTTGTTSLTAIGKNFAIQIDGKTGATTTLTAWQILAVVMIVMALCFKMAAVPLHFYAGDVYQGAATPVTAFLSFVPKATGFVALIKIMWIIGGGDAFAVPPQIAKMIWVIAALTMTVGNVLGLMQTNIKRVLAYSSIAHSGYMLVGVAALISGVGYVGSSGEAMRGITFYLAAYGIMNAGAFGVLMLLPAKADLFDDHPTRLSAETFHDIAGVGRNHIVLALAMAISCFSLIGLPLTVGFWGKYFLIVPALTTHNYWLVVILVLNAAIAAAYYLRIVGTMFLPEDHPAAIKESTAHPASSELLTSTPVMIAVAISVGASMLFGMIPSATDILKTRAEIAQQIDAALITPPPSTQPDERMQQPLLTSPPTTNAANR